MEPGLEPHIDNGNGKERTAHASYIIFFGLFVELMGLVWDLFYHYASGVQEGLGEFFLVPAHDFFIVGFAIAWVGALMLFRALRD